MASCFTVALPGLAVLASSLLVGCSGAKDAHDQGTFVEVVQPSASADQASPGPRSAASIQGKHAECSKVIGIINAGVNKVGMLQEAGDLGLMASAMDRVADDIEKCQVADPDLAREAAAYQRMSRNIAQAARAMKGAVENKDPDRAANAEASLHTATDAEDGLVDRINHVCSGPSTR